MPFTFSHPAGVLPGLRTDSSGALRGRGPLLASALVAGSLAPDVPFFVDSVVPGTYGYGRIAHRAAGVLLLDPLIAAGLAGGWSLVRAPLVALLPPQMQGRAALLLGVGGGEESGPGRFWASAAAGAATHVLWDAFTHHGRWGVRLLPGLERPVRGVPLHHWAQYVSSAAGLAALGVSSVRAVRRAPRVPTPAAVPRLTTRGRRAATAALGVAALTGAVTRCRRDRPRHLSSLIASATFGAGAGFGLAAPAYAAVVRVRERAGGTRDA